MMGLAWQCWGDNHELFRLVFTYFCANQACGMHGDTVGHLWMTVANFFTFHTWQGFGELEVKEVTKLISASQRKMQIITLYLNESSISFGQGGLPPVTRGRGSLVTPVLEVPFWESIRSQKNRARVEKPHPRRLQGNTRRWEISLCLSIGRCCLWLENQEVLKVVPISPHPTIWPWEF